MKRIGYIDVPRSATRGGAPIDAFQADAFRQNDVLFEKLLRAVLATPFIPNGYDGPKTDPPAHQILQATTITVSSAITLTPKVPLIWLAREKITINNTINADGKGAQPGEDGDFGGSGGGGTAAGKDCKLPVSGHTFLNGGAAGASGNNLTEEWASRALAILALCKGGASGGDATGGAGGGVVVLCASEIEIAGTGQINAKGANGSSGNAGGGGGGLIVLIAHELKNIHTSGASQNVQVNGGTGTGSGGNGGNGLVLQRTFTR